MKGLTFKTLTATLQRFDHLGAVKHLDYEVTFRLQHKSSHNPLTKLISRTHQILTAAKLLRISCRLITAPGKWPVVNYFKMATLAAAASRGPVYICSLAVGFLAYVLPHMGGYVAKFCRQRRALYLRPVICWLLFHYRFRTVLLGHFYKFRFCYFWFC